jgi:hypothetical protein
MAEELAGSHRLVNRLRLELDRTQRRAQRAEQVASDAGSASPCTPCSVASMASPASGRRSLPPLPFDLNEEVRLASEVRHAREEVATLATRLRSLMRDVRGVVRIRANNTAAAPTSYNVEPAEGAEDTLNLSNGLEVPTEEEQGKLVQELQTTMALSSRQAEEAKTQSELAAKEKHLYETRNRFGLRQRSAPSLGLATRPQNAAATSISGKGKKNQTSSENDKENSSIATAMVASASMHAKFLVK